MWRAKRTAEAWLRDVLDQAERGVLPGMVRTGRTLAQAAEEYLRYLTDDRQREPSTVRDARAVIRNHLLPPFGARRLEDITESEVERRASRLGAERPLSNATKRKVIVVFHGVMARACRVYGLPVNPVAAVEKPRLAPPGAIDVFSPEEVHALVRAAASEQDAAIFLTAAFTGLRQGKLVALRWRDVRFAGSYIRVTASYTNGELSTPKSGKVRSVPMAPEVAEGLARLGQRERFVGPDDLVFVGLVGGHLDASALLRRYRAALRAADLGPLRFHDLRHTVGTRVIAHADIRRVQEWMGTRTCRRRCGTCTMRRVTTTRRSWRGRSARTPVPTSASLRSHRGRRRDPANRHSDPVKQDDPMSSTPCGGLA